MARKSSFAPMTDEHTRLLVLGSLPGEMALALAQYYGNPRNHFWRLISAVIGRDLVPLPYDERLQGLREARVGLWDVVGSAIRPGSLDAAMKDVEPNRLRELVESLPNLRAVGLNGGTSAKLGQRILAGVPQALIPLPSSSPAYTVPFERKLEAWLKLRDYL